jgi:hypothetical protein
MTAAKLQPAQAAIAAMLYHGGPLPFSPRFFHCAFPRFFTVPPHYVARSRRVSPMPAISSPAVIVRFLASLRSRARP